MKRSFALLALGFFVATVSADVPPPKGSKRVTLDWKITTEQEFPDYTFYTAVGGGGKGGKAGEGVTMVKLDPKTTAEIKGAGRSPGIGRQGSLYAVPKGAEEKFGSEKEFFTALRMGKVEGALRAKTNFDSITVIKDTDPRTTVVWEYKVEKVDKDGITGKMITEDKKDADKKDTDKKDADKKDPAKKDSPDDDDAAVATAPKGGVWIAGLAATLALVFAGVWLAGRRHPRSA
jgi:hypothetical protein